MFKRTTCSLILLLISSPTMAGQWSAVLGVEHISSVFDGKPFNDKPELQTDFVYGGLRWKDDDWRVDIMISNSLNNIGHRKECNNNYVWNEPVDGVRTSTHQSTECKTSSFGSNPRAIFRIEKEWSL